MSRSYANGIELSESDSTVTERTAVCPECDTEYKSLHGMSSHHSKIHGGKVYLVRTCSYCSGKIAKGLGDYNETAENHFCSDECESHWRSETFRGKDHPRWSGGQPTVECCMCGDPVKRSEKYIEKYDDITCSKECGSKAQSERMSKENNPNWKENSHTTSVCGHCSDEFRHGISKERKYCSRSCKAKDHTGNDAPNWKGGWVDGDYGANWREQRQKALERDGRECIMCGLSEGEAKTETNSPLHVHHRKRKETFRNEDGSLDYEAANRLSNLITLCVQCHGMWEEIAIQPVVK